MKKFILSTLVILMASVIIYTGIKTVFSDNQCVIIDDNQKKVSKNTFKLDMTKNEVLDLIKAKNLKIILDENHGSEGSSIYCENIRFIFDKSNKTIEIFVYENNLFKSSKGLSIGDSLQKFKNLYGNDFRTHEEPDAIIYHFRYESNFFSVIISNDIVVGWGIHKYCEY